MKETLLTLLIIASLWSCETKAQNPIDTLLSGSALISKLRTDYTPNQTLGYGPARDVMYSVVDNDGNNGVHGIYTDFTVQWNPSEDPSQSVYQGGSGINAEHVYPQSMGAGNEPAKSDMHNIRPCRIAVNSARGNLKFGESPDNNTDTWYKNAVSQSNTPGADIDEWSERDANNVFEPRETVKGDIARIVFYFYTIYPNADASFFNSMKNTLYDWHYLDPVDSWELDRNNKVKQEQGNDNPFILDSTLARRAFFPQYSVTSTNQVDIANDQNFKVYPNPFVDRLTFSEPVNYVLITDASGKTVLEYNSDIQAISILDVSDLSKGVFYIRYQVGNKRKGSKTIVKQ
ncbi:MAG: endonuclease [Saprospiraceae bacterium]